jgi:hypothetical protein
MPRRAAVMFELMLASGKVVRWQGASGEDASRRYVDAHRDAAVVAWRNADRHGLSALTRGAVIDGCPVR